MFVFDTLDNNSRFLLPAILHNLYSNYESYNFRNLRPPFVTSATTSPFLCATYSAHSFKRMVDGIMTCLTVWYLNILFPDSFQVLPVSSPLWLLTPETSSHHHPHKHNVHHNYHIHQYLGCHILYISFIIILWFFIFKVIIWFSIPEIIFFRRKRKVLFVEHCVSLTHYSTSSSTKYGFPPALFLVPILTTKGFRLVRPLLNSGLLS